MNTTDQALLLFRRLQALPPSTRGALIKYRAYRRWKRRDAKLPGTIRPSSGAAKADWGCREHGAAARQEVA